MFKTFRDCTEPFSCIVEALIAEWSLSITEKDMTKKIKKSSGHHPSQVTFRLCYLSGLI